MKTKKTSFLKYCNYPFKVSIKFLDLILTDNVKSYIDEHPVNRVFHLKTLEENVGLEQSDGLRRLCVETILKNQLYDSKCIRFSCGPLIPCRLKQKGKGQKQTPPSFVDF